MTHSPRRLVSALLWACACALAAGGCCAPGGLGAGGAAPPVSVQPRPEAVPAPTAGCSPGQGGPSR
ncbi:hypothetical protein ACFWSF_01495 [Streptomyces sp. NPDC058611]|uniref:hypothetical protein n=1 Tax=unclassified Streptomyces TaxID=2593676 RepID=UPI00365A23C2